MAEDFKGPILCISSFKTELYRSYESLLRILFSLITLQTKQILGLICIFLPFGGLTWSFRITTCSFCTVFYCYVCLSMLNSSYYRNFQLSHAGHSSWYRDAYVRARPSMRRSGEPSRQWAFSNGSTTSDSNESYFEQAKSPPPAASTVLTHSLRNPKSVKKMMHIIYMRILRGSLGTMSSAALRGLECAPSTSTAMKGCLRTEAFSILGVARYTGHRLLTILPTFCFFNLTISLKESSLACFLSTSFVWDFQAHHFHDKESSPLL